MDTHNGDPEFQMTGISGSCWSWNFCNASLVQLIFTYYSM
ncbi:hypothetical protein DCAR_0520690 [Daucus carota subsp. sativus]|uniref:Uncharacterized protein n=1 Tax=Daucus carota subsp. sativus TaxID=79200 RepID=A0AAF0X493_DAUCS|nr:hypothetical protein DCAR_0520690 [Daucus carota subsp. sativus]